MQAGHSGEIARTNIGPRRNKQRGKAAAAPATDAKQFSRSTYEADIAKTTVGPSRGRGRGKARADDGIARTRLGPAMKSNGGASARTGAAQAPGAKIERSRSSRGRGAAVSSATEHIQATRLGPGPNRGPSRVRVRQNIDIHQKQETQSSGVTRARIGPNRQRAPSGANAEGVQRTRIGPRGRGDGAAKTRRLGPSNATQAPARDDAARARVGPKRSGSVSRSGRIGPSKSGGGVQRTRMGPRAARGGATGRGATGRGATGGVQLE